MTLDEKQQLFKAIRAEGNVLPDDELTYEHILQRTRDDFAEAFEKAKASGIKIHKADVPFPENVKSVVLNTDVLATLGHICTHTDHEDETAKKMLYYIIKGVVAPAVTSTIFLEVDQARSQGDKETYMFTVKFCAFLDSSEKLEDIARLTYQTLTR